MKNINVEAAVEPREKEADNFLKDYLLEPDSDKRIEMAGSFFTTSDVAIDILTNTYIRFNEFSSEFDNARKATNTSGKSPKERWQDNKQEPIKVEGDDEKMRFRPLTHFEVYVFSCAFDKIRGENNSHIAWEGLREYIGKEGTLTPEIEEQLTWFKKKAEEGKVILLPKEIGKSANVEITFAFNPEKDSRTLLIDTDRASGYSAAFIVSALAHEHGHETIAEYRETHPSQLGDTEIPFNEFFAYMEELRTYYALKKINYPNIEELETRYEPNIKNPYKTIGIVRDENVDLQFISFEHPVTRAISLLYVHAVRQEAKRKGVTAKTKEGITQIRPEDIEWYK